MIVPLGTRTISRPHTGADSPLRGWSAADQLVLDHLAVAALGSVLIVNDEFGALTLGLAEHEPEVWTDSIVSRAAIESNLAANGFAPLGNRSISGNELPGGSYDTVVVRIPKTSALLDHQLAALRSGLAAGARVIGVGMARHVHRSTIAAFERMIGPASTSRATQKARLIFAEIDISRRSDGVLPTHGEFTTPEGVTVAEAPGVFSAGHLDVGTALLLQTIAEIHPESPPAEAVIADLGCGNGVVGATLGRRWPNPRFVLIDSSDLAVASARRTWQLNDLDPDRATIEVADGFASVPDGSLDIVVTNPPFHQGHALDNDMTDRLMATSARALAPEGTLVAVAQRQLNLHTRLRRWFDRVEVPSKHPSHVVLLATGPSQQ